MCEQNTCIYYSIRILPTLPSVFACTGHIGRLILSLNNIFCVFLVALLTHFYQKQLFVDSINMLTEH